jgi:predicted acylesterase/phospholipase RssA
MGIDDTNSHVQSLEQGATEARVRSKFVPPKTAFVFAGGGSLGVVQAGMLRELTRRGVMSSARRWER